jgi:peptidoglycan/xylan/chitin deacetylase (PgdA/CDA1 family)
MKNLIKNLIFIILNLFSGDLKNKASILMYHSVGDNSAFFTVKIDDFEKQLIFIKKNYRIISLKDLFIALKDGKNFDKSVVVTFDDGYQDNYGNVFPLIKKYEIPITIFLTTGKIGGFMENSEKITLPILKRNQIAEMMQSGFVDFMPHTINHSVLSELDYEKQQEEIIDSCKSLEEITGQKKCILAYPRGKYNDLTLDILKKNNWLGGVTVESGLVSLEDNPLELKRNSVDSSTTMSQFKGKLKKSIEIYKKIKCLK